MPSLILPSRANQQPPQGARINASSELGRMLAATVTASQTSNPVNKRDITLAAGVSRVQTPYGVAFQHSASNGNVGFGVPGGLSTLIPIGTSFSVYMRLFVSALGVRQGLMTDHDAAGSNESYTIEITAANEWKISIVGGANAAVLPGVTVGWHDLLVVYRAGVGHQIYVDGATAGFLFTTNLVAGSALRLGSFGTYTALGFQGRVAVCHIFRGDVSPFLPRLFDNPWQVFAAPPRRLWVATDAPAGGAYTLPAAQGSYTITGTAANLRAARKLPAAQGAYALTGNPAILRAGRRLTAAPGAYTLTGAAANLIKGTAPRALEAAGGSYIITGRAATLKAGRRMLAAQGAYTISGKPVADPIVGLLTGTVLFRPFRTTPTRVVRLA